MTEKTDFETRVITPITERLDLIEAALQKRWTAPLDDPARPLSPWTKFKRDVTRGGREALGIVLTLTVLYLLAEIFK